MTDDADGFISQTTLNRVRAELFREHLEAPAVEVVVVNELTDDRYLIGPQVASAAVYNTVLRRAVKAEAERDGRREMLRTAAEEALDQIRALHQPYRSVYDEGDNRSCAHCNQLTGYAVPYPCDTVKALDGEPSDRSDSTPEGTER